uniref:Aldedh domain-containing protein n=1 Tax=Syphacia muris TaxID=451379 RepID=A0A0N5AK02_9BILA
MLQGENYKWAVKEGDLAFFVHDAAGAEDIDKAILSVCTEVNVFHTGILKFDEQLLLVHALPSQGVIVENFQDALKKLDADQVFICSVNVDQKVKESAFGWALRQVGSPYNDIFSPDCVNSKGDTSYYCCQLVVKAYEKYGIENLCSNYTLNFRGSDGQFLPYWIQYFNNKGCPIPQGLPGSHPSFLIRSKSLVVRLSFPVNMSRFSVLKRVDPALHYLSGCRMNPETSKRFNVVEPRSGEVLTSCSAADSKLLDRAVNEAKTAQPGWMEMGIQVRGSVLRKAAAIIRECIDDLAYWESIDCGKPICESRVDMKICAETFEFYSGLSASLAGSHFNLSKDRYAYTERIPWGIVGAIGVWNYPMQTASWKLAPALICGNAVIYKPSEYTPITAVILAEIFHNAGLPDGVLSVIQGDGETGQMLCSHKDVNKVTFTGSCNTGAKVYKSCAKQGFLRPLTLELGGKSSLIICEDADIENAVLGALMANYFCQGEVCTNASKVLVHESIYEDFRQRICQATSKIIVGDPLNEETRCGALITYNHLQKVLGFIDDAIKKGANVVFGGKKVEVKGFPNGFYLEPTILDNVNKEMRVYNEEIFGPVMLLIPFKSVEEAINIANETPYGLANGIFTKNLSTAYSAASKLHAGTVYVNTYNDTDVVVPFGGIKQSGFGRENGIAALDAFSQLKSVFVDVRGKLDNCFSV